MATKSLTFTIIVCLILASSLVSAFDLSDKNKIENKIERQNLQDCTKAQIYEYINRFSLPLKDIRKLVTNQFSRNSIKNFESANKIYFENIVSVSSLTSDDQSYIYATPFKATVYNSNLQLNINYTIIHTKNFRNHTYNVHTKVTNISIVYEKEFKIDNGSFVINSVNVKFDANFIKSTFDPAPPSNQTTIFNSAITGTSNNTLYTNLVQLFDNDLVKKSMQTNSKGDHISQIFPQNPYNYRYYTGYNISIDISTINYFTKDGSLTNGIKGKLPQGNSFCTQFVPDFTNTGASMFISKQFAMNFVQYNLMKYAGWKNIKVDSTTIRQSLLQWKLLDLDFIVDGLWNDLGQFANNQIYFTCDVQNQISTQFQINANKLHQVMQWACKGYVKLNQTTGFKIVDFTTKINHITDLKIYQGTLNMYVNQLQLVDTHFNEVISLNQKGKYTVNQNGQILARRYIQSVFNDFRTYPVGDRFVISSNAKSLQVEDAGNGIWVLV